MKMPQRIMEKLASLKGLTLSCSTIFSQTRVFSTDASQKYIVILREKKYKDSKLATLSHINLLSSVLGSKKDALASIVCSYNSKLSGFSAKLTIFQANKLKNLPEVIDLWNSRSFPLQTNASWDFFSLMQNESTSSILLKKANQGEGIIIGVIDSGIWPESKSFSDEGYGPIPSRWKGICQEGEFFDKSHCNKKIIGARWYAKSIPKEILDKDFCSARDYLGHGTFVASIAAGNFVNIKGFPDIVEGTIHGGAPRAMLAIYKVVWGIRCNEDAVFNAIFDAIEDGVDIVSISVEAWQAGPIILAAIMNGISVITAAGNFGPKPYTVRNAFLWVTTVAATTINRSFATIITLGNKTKVMGQSVFFWSLPEFKRLIYIKSVPEDCIFSYEVANKIVFYNSPDSSKNLEDFLIRIQSAGAVGLIIEQFSTVCIESCHHSKKFPYVIVDKQASLQILKYIESTSSPFARVDRTSTVIGKKMLAPKIADFSSRGPDSYYSCIKPDIAAPGVTIFSLEEGFFHYMSGTSAACPHVSGIVALLKAIHPTWSPAAIKSAIMTTATIKDSSGECIKADDFPDKIADPFDFGSGCINPNKAAEPGLIYDISPEEYLEYFRETSLNTLVVIKPLHFLNLPSVLVKDLKTSVTITQIVTNVGQIDAIYTALVRSPTNVIIKVSPMKLAFNASKTKHTFKIFLTVLHKVPSKFSFESLAWSDDAGHSVTIPIAII